MERNDDHLIARFIRDAGRLSLSLDEKARIKAALTAATREHRAVPSPFSSARLWRRLVPIGALLILFVTGLPVVQAANRSLPGDLLYPVKTNVIEEVEELFEPAETRAAYHASLAERRFSEAREALRRNNPREAVLEDVRPEIEEHGEALLEALTAQARDDEAVLEFGGKLSVTLGALETVLEDDGGDVHAVTERVDAVLAESARSFADDRPHEDVEALINEKLEAIETKTFIDADTPDDVAAVAARLEEALGAVEDELYDEALIAIIELERDLEVRDLLDNHAARDEAEEDTDVPEDGVEPLPETSTSTPPLEGNDEPVQDPRLGDDAPTNASGTGDPKIPLVPEALPDL